MEISSPRLIYPNKLFIRPCIAFRITLFKDDRGRKYKYGNKIHIRDLSIHLSQSVLHSQVILVFLLKICLNLHSFNSINEIKIYLIGLD